MPLCIRLFEVVMILASIIWITSIFLGHEAHIKILSKALDVDDHPDLIGEIVYIAMASITLFHAHVIYTVSRGGDNISRWLYIAACIVVTVQTPESKRASSGRKKRAWSLTRACVATRNGFYRWYATPDAARCAGADARADRGALTC